MGTRRTGLEVWRAVLEEQPGAEEREKRSRRKGERKQTCYDIDGGATQAAGQGGLMEEGATNMKNKHKKKKKAGEKVLKHRPQQL